MDLILRDLACARGGVTVLEGVTFRLVAGRALILRGPNGIGKTTLLRTVAGLQPAVSGEVELPPESAAFAGHADGIKATLTVAENLAFWAAVFGTGEIGPAMQAMDLGALADRPARNLSAGQKRRLGLARLMVTGRAIWLMDEPTVSLDDGSVGLFAAMIGAHLAAGGIALIATHADPGIEAEGLDLGRFRARTPAAGTATGTFDEAFG